MKKIIVLLMLTALSLSLLVSCSSKEEDYTLSLGVTASVSGTKVTETFAAVVTDSEGKIVNCRIDVIEFEAKIDNKGEQIAVKPISKRDQGNDYGMGAYAPKGEWYKQAEHFEKFVEGLTLDELRGMSLMPGENADLAAGCTIWVSDFVNAVTKAIEGTNKYSFTAKGDITSAVSGIGSTELDTDNTDFKFGTDFAAVVSAKGRVVSAAIDSMEVVLDCEVADGNLSVVNVTNKGTKFELGDNYGMAIYDENNTKGEWYVQARECAKAAVGYETKKLSVYLEDNVAGCTMYIDGYKNALIKAADSVR